VSRTDLTAPELATFDIVLFLGMLEFAPRRTVRVGDCCVFDCAAIASPAAADYVEIATGRHAPESAGS
jgi:hypothetical protein